MFNARPPRGVARVVRRLNRLLVARGRDSSSPVRGDSVHPNTQTPKCLNITWKGISPPAGTVGVQGRCGNTNAPAPGTPLRLQVMVLWAARGAHMSAAGQVYAAISSRFTNERVDVGWCRMVLPNGEVGTVRAGGLSPYV